jgi:CRP/FNR family transcriptional regulator
VDGVTQDDLDGLETRCEPHTLRRKQVLWMPGDSADRVYFVRTGIMKVSKVTEEGRELTLQFHIKGDLFGEVAAFSPGLHETMSEAYEDTALYSLSRDEFLRFMRTWPEVALRVTGLVFERRKRLESRVGGLLFKTAHARLASLFLDLAADFGVRDSRGVIINLKLTHKEMASLIGATRETVSFAILDLRKDGLIQTEAKRVVILDEGRLREFIKA